MKTLQAMDIRGYRNLTQDDITVLKNTYWHIKILS